MKFLFPLPQRLVFQPQYFSNKPLFSRLYTSNNIDALWCSFHTLPYGKSHDLQITVMIIDLKGLDWSRLLESGNKLNNINLACWVCEQTRKERSRQFTKLQHISSLFSLSNISSLIFYTLIFTLAPNHLNSHQQYCIICKENFIYYTSDHDPSKVTTSILWLFFHKYIK